MGQESGKNWEKTKKSLIFYFDVCFVFCNQECLFFICKYLFEINIALFLQMVSCESHLYRSNEAR